MTKWRDEKDTSIRRRDESPQCRQMGRQQDLVVRLIRRYVCLLSLLFTSFGCYGNDVVSANENPSDVQRQPPNDMDLIEIADADARETQDASVEDIADMETRSLPDSGEQESAELDSGGLTDGERPMANDMDVASIVDLGSVPDASAEPNAIAEPDHNGDGVINILLLGSNTSIRGGSAFSPEEIATELSRILNANGSGIPAQVVSEDIHKEKAIVVGLGQNGAEYTFNHHSHSLLQYYYWPEQQTARWENLAGVANHVWDHVIIAADPHIVAAVPGYHALGVHKVVTKVQMGGAAPWLLSAWSQDVMMQSDVERGVRTSRKIAENAPLALNVIPASLAWQNVPTTQRDSANAHPTPNGAYLTAAAIYTSLTNQNASMSGYTYDDRLATIAFDTVQSFGVELLEPNMEVDNELSPFSGCHLDEDVISYNHTGTSSERGILGGMNWVFEQAPEVLQNGGESLINFNYGRANTNFEPNKRYQIDPERFQFSLGFAMQDNGNHGNESMLYGLDKRDSGTLNDTDLGVALYMIYQSELPQARAIPIRTLFAQMREAMPGQSAYRDRWHMHRDLDRATGAFIYTLLTGNCVLPDEPFDRTSAQWRSWMAHKIGYETAWTLMHLETPPNCP